MYDLGYDPEVLGRNRLSGIQNVVCKQAVSAKGFHERPQRMRGEGSAGGGDTTTQAELDEELGYSKYDYKNKDTDNSRNGHSSKRLRTSFGEVDVSVPRDRKP